MGYSLITNNNIIIIQSSEFNEFGQRENLFSFGIDRWNCELFYIIYHALRFMNMKQKSNFQPNYNKKLHSIQFIISQLKIIHANVMNLMAIKIHTPNFQLND